MGEVGEVGEMGEVGEVRGHQDGHDRNINHLELHRQDSTCVDVRLTRRCDTATLIHWNNPSLTGPEGGTGSDWSTWREEWAKAVRAAVVAA